MASNLGNFIEDVELIEAKTELYKHALASADGIMLRTAIELGIADIIHSHGQPMSLTQIASKMESTSPSNMNLNLLACVMLTLARRKIFTGSDRVGRDGQETEVVYGLTATSKWLIRDHEYSLAPMLLAFTHPLMAMPWFQVGSCVKEGGDPFLGVHGQAFYDMLADNREFSDMFNDGMAAVTKTTIDVLIKEYKDGFSKMEGTLVDVGGNMGYVVAKIVKTYPHIKGINFDQPHIIKIAPQHPGVTNVGGDIFEQIPSADNIIIKTILVDWLDDKCVTILKNCRKAVSEKKGKVIIVDTIVYPDRYELFDDAAIALSSTVTVLNNSKLRTENEWIQLVNKAGFTDVNIVPLPDLVSLIILNY